jgi:hypothetical protein
MSERGMLFVEDWRANHVLAAGDAPEGDHSQAAKYAQDCLAAAEKSGITKDEIEEDYGDLVDHMGWAMDDANEAEVAKLANKG